MKNNNISILGIPLDLGAETLGVGIGPNAFRNQKIVEKLITSGFIVNDLGDISCKNRNELEIGDLHLRYLDEITRVSEESAKIIKQEIDRNHRILTLGGDHSIAIGSISGASTAVNGKIGLIWIDAHGDINTDKTTLTGNIHGMPLAALLEMGAKQLTNISGTRSKIMPENVVHIGGCDYDPKELEIIRENNIFTYDIVDILAGGLAPLFKQIESLFSKCSNVWVSLDLDAIDSTYAPGVGMPNKGGLTYREIEVICEFIGKNESVLGIDVVEYNPLQDIEGKTSELAIELSAKLLGSNYSWYSNYLSNNKLPQ